MRVMIRVCVRCFELRESGAVLCGFLSSITKREMDEDCLGWAERNAHIPLGFSILYKLISISCLFVLTLSISS